MTRERQKRCTLRHEKACNKPSQKEVKVKLIRPDAWCPSQRHVITQLRFVYIARVWLAYMQVPETHPERRAKPGENPSADLTFKPRITPFKMENERTAFFVRWVEAGQRVGGEWSKRGGGREGRR